MTNSNFGIKKTFNENDFIREFEAYNRQDNFTHEGLQVLFSALEEMAQDCGMNIEMDVIALCCEYSELSINDVINDYRIDVSSCENEDDKEEEVREYLQDNTFVCGSYEIDGVTHFLFQAF